jgi:GNAT superfamily N-acetyltransferase
MRIRAARADEAAELSALSMRSKAHWGYDEAFMEQCREELTFRPGEVERRRTSVAERNGRVIGLVTLEGEPPEGVLGMMFVDPPAMGQGVGRRLFEHMLANARKLGFRRLTFDADPHAVPFYRAMGAVRVGTVPSGSIPGRELPLMAVDLVPHGVVSGGK